MPHRITVVSWLEKDEVFRSQYARAREAQADFLVDEILDIADDGRRDYKKDADGREVPDYDHIQRSRLRVDTRKWFASKVFPKLYGDKQTHEHSGPDGRPIPIAPVIHLFGKPDPDDNERSDGEKSL